MRALLIFALVLLLGIGAGLGIALARVHIYYWEGVPLEMGGLSPGVRRSKPADRTGPRPKVVVDDDTYDFGRLDDRSTGEHDFVLTNVGTAPLHLAEGPTSCRCTISKLNKSRLAPGESTTVTVNWSGEELFGSFRHTAKIETDDPDRSVVTLSIMGEIFPAVRAVPSPLVFSDVAGDRDTTGTVRLFGYLPEPLELGGWELGIPETAEYFDVAVAPLPADQLDEEANCGYRVDVTLKSGLPSGPFQQTILFKTNTMRVPTYTVPIEGTVAGRITVVGRGWNARAGVLNLGNVLSSEGARRDLWLRIKDSERTDVEFNVVEMVPDVFDVEIGPTQRPDSGSGTLTRLTIEIPKGTRAVNHVGPDPEELGRIVIHTDHPDAPELKILVQFAVAR